MKVRWTNRALRDVADAYSYVAGENEEAAGRLAARLMSAGDRLADHPRMGRPVQEGRRLIVVDRFVVIYRVAGSEVRILRVVHGARRRKGP